MSCQRLNVGGWGDVPLSILAGCPPPVCMFVSLYVRMSISPYIHNFLCPSVRTPNVRMSISLYFLVHNSVRPCPYVHKFVCPYINMGICTVPKVLSRCLYYPGGCSLSGYVHTSIWAYTLPRFFYHPPGCSLSGCNRLNRQVVQAGRT